MRSGKSAWQRGAYWFPRTLSGGGYGQSAAMPRSGHFHLHRMVRAQLIQRIAELNPHLRPGVAEAVVRTILDRMGEALVQEERIALRGFGTFKTNARGARGHNPRTGEAVAVPARRDVRFRASTEMLHRLNDKVGGAAHPEAVSGADRRLRATC